MKYFPNQRVRIKMTFRDVDKTLTDPTSITAKIMDPTGDVTEQTYLDGDIIKTSDGEYYFEFVLTMSGEWTWWVWGDEGSVPEASSSGVIKVERLPRQLTT